MLKECSLAKIGQPHPGGPDVISGIVYPSVAMRALGDNVAILPSEVEKKLALVEVILLTYDSTEVIPTGFGANGRILIGYSVILGS